VRIKVLGCSGAEFPGHNPPSFLLDESLVFDAGSLTSVLSERAQLRVKHIFVTHAHLDHVRDITFLADNIIVSGRQQQVSIISIPSVLETIRLNVLNDKIWPDFTIIPNYKSAVLGYRAVQAGKALKVNGYRVTPIPVVHSVPAVGYLVEDHDGKSFFYTGDTGPTPDTWKRLGKRQLDVLIIETSFPNKLTDLAVKTGHLTANLLREELLSMKELPKRIFITHPKPQYLKRIKAEIKKLGFRNLSVLKDGQAIRI
jgi:ribonuclease BN (tRNA processing enzyme)